MAPKELSYHPNVMAQALRQGKRHTIGVVVPRLQFTVFGEIVKSIEQTAQGLGYATLISTTEESAKVERETLSRLRNGFVDGIIIAGTGACGCRRISGWSASPGTRWVKCWKPP